MLILALVLLLVVSVAVATLRLRRALLAALRERRFARARRLEREARRVLSRSGYQVDRRRVRRRVWLEVDGREEGFVVEADYLVRGLRDELLVAEVKTGARAPDPTYTPTRRQLLEYDLAFAEAEGLLLVDMEREKVETIRFPSPEEIAERSS